MSAAAEKLLHELQRLSPKEQQEIMRELQRISQPRVKPLEAIPTIKVPGGAITSEQVAEALDDE